MDRWGPLARLAGEWEGDAGMDTAYSHELGRVIDTPYRERCSMKPFGPVVNGDQQLFGLDYRTSMWRDDERTPFHTEVGYWLWDPRSGEIVRAFVVPRGITVLAGGHSSADGVRFTLKASKHDPDYGVGENRYLAKNASSLSYEVTIMTSGDDEWSYDETTMLQMKEFEGAFAHTDRNTLLRTA